MRGSVTHLTPINIKGQTSYRMYGGVCEAVCAAGGLCVSLRKHVVYLQPWIYMECVCVCMLLWMSVSHDFCVCVCRSPSSRTWCSVWNGPTGCPTTACGREAANTTTAAPSCTPGQSEAPYRRVQMLVFTGCWYPVSLNTFQIFPTLCRCSLYQQLYQSSLPSRNVSDVNR